MEVVKAEEQERRWLPYVTIQKNGEMYIDAHGHREIASAARRILSKHELEEIKRIRRKYGIDPESKSAKHEEEAIRRLVRTRGTEFERDYGRYVAVSLEPLAGEEDSTKVLLLASLGGGEAKHHLRAPLYATSTGDLIVINLTKRGRHYENKYTGHWYGSKHKVLYDIGELGLSFSHEITHGWDFDGGNKNEESRILAFDRVVRKHIDENVLVVG